MLMKEKRFLKKMFLSEDLMTESNILGFTEVKEFSPVRSVFCAVIAFCDNAITADTIS